MIKLKSLIVALCLGMVLAFVATQASAMVIDVNYYWFDTEGSTRAVDSSGVVFTVGNTEGDALFKVEERWQSGDQRIGDSFDYEGVGEFKYDIHVDEYTGKIYDFRIYNPTHIVAVATIPAFYGTDKQWSETHTSDYWYWYTNSYPINGAQSYFYIYTNAPRGIVDGEASDYIDAHHVTFANGLVSGPVLPEPSSMLLLGMGLFGFAGRAVRKRLKA